MLLIGMFILVVFAGVFVSYLYSQQSRGSLGLNSFVVFLCDFFYAFLGPSCANFGISTQAAPQAQPQAPLAGK